MTPGSIDFPARDDATFHILQLTDFHNDQCDDLTERTWADVRALVNCCRPDLLMVTGDIWCSDLQPDLGPVRMRRELERLGDLQVPWAFVWGNHDWVDDIETRQREISCAPNAVMPPGDGRGNYRLEIHRDNEAVWDIFAINSGREWSPESDLAYFEQESVRLAKERGRVLTAVAYYHIPLAQYETARLNGRYTGVAQEEVLCWGDDGSILERFKQAGNVRIGFCGHSHLNDYHFVQDGVTLSYGRVTGHGTYALDRIQRGGTLLVIDTAMDTFSFNTVFPQCRGS